MDVDYEKLEATVAAELQKFAHRVTSDMKYRGLKTIDTPREYWGYDNAAGYVSSVYAITALIAAAYLAFLVWFGLHVPGWVGPPVVQPRMTGLYMFLSGLVTVVVPAMGWTKLKSIRDNWPSERLHCCALVADDPNSVLKALSAGMTPDFINELVDAAHAEAQAERDAYRKKVANTRTAAVKLLGLDTAPPVEQQGELSVVQGGELSLHRKDTA